MRNGYKKIIKNLNAVDIATIFYALISALYIIYGSFKLDGYIMHIIIRIFIISFIFIISTLDNKIHNKGIKFVRNFYPLLFLSYWYGETDYLNNIIFPNLDHFFVNLEYKLWGFQPSLEFSKAFPDKWFNELMNFGYFSYYFLNFIVCFVIYLKNHENAIKSIFMVCFSFYLYYIFFSIFPVVGPQFYFQPPDSLVPDAYLFREAVKLVQKIGEKPTGAFPSSHVGIAVILLYCSWKNNKKLFYSILPSVIILFFATVYIKAHYLIDVIFGFISAYIFIIFSDKVYKFINNKYILKN